MHQRAAEFVECVSARYGMDVDVTEFPEGTKTAADAAEAIGCEVGQIASSLVFSVGAGAESPENGLVVVVTSGANRVSEAKLAAHLGADEDAVGMADADEVRTAIGWSIGGVPPLCHETDVPVLFDQSLSEYETIWAAAGTPTTVFPIAPDELAALANAESADVAE